MNQKLRVSFNSPQSGWMSIGLKTDDESFVTAVSHQPYDSLRDLMKALSAFLNDGEDQKVKWNCEPEEYDFELRRDGENAVLEIARFPDHRRTLKKREVVFRHEAPALSICNVFWQSLRELHGDIDVDEFDKNWRRTFPEEEMQAFTKAVKEAKRASTNR